MGWPHGSWVRQTVQFPCLKDFPGGSDGKESTCQCRRLRFDPWVGKIPGEGNGNPLQYSCLGNPMDRGAWQATVHGVSKSQTQLSMHTPMLKCQYNNFLLDRLPVNSLILGCGLRECVLSASVLVWRSFLGSLLRAEFNWEGSLSTVSVEKGGMAKIRE